MNRLTRTKTTILVAFAIAVIGFSLFLTNDISSQDGQPRTYIIPMEDWVHNDDVGAVRLINILLEEGVPVYWALEPFTVGGTTYPAGTFYVNAPFATRSGISCDATMDWFMWQAKINRVWRVDVTTETFTVRSKQLVLPRVAMFYDTSTYENALVHYLRFRSLGFKVVLANARDIYSKSWNQSGSVLSQANVFVMPGGALHLWSFPYGNRRTWGIANITEFVKNGGGYVGVCAGATESLMGSPWTNLGLVNASYHNEWFDYPYPWQGDWDWRQLIGPMYIEVEESDHPVMFGYGANAARPGYGPKTTVYYYGGPAMYDVGYNATILAKYSGPVTQKITEKVSNILGEAAIISADYYSGKAVLFGPHPEWPGPGARLYAQALYYVANIPKPSRLEPNTSVPVPSMISADRVGKITSTVSQIKPILEETTRTAAKIVNMRAGDHYHPLGLWYDESVLAYSKELHNQLNEIQRAAVKFQYEYFKLNVLENMVGNDPESLQLINYAKAMINSFFNLTENLPSEPHSIDETDWTGAGPFEPFEPEDEATTFEDFVSIFQYINNETSAALYPYAKDYSKLFAEYERLRIQNETAYTPEVNATLADLYMNITSSWPAGPLYKGMYTFRHTLNIMQYKIDYHLLNLLTVADRTSEVISCVEFALAIKVGSWNYALAEMQAFLAYPSGPFV